MGSGKYVELLKLKHLLGDQSMGKLQFLEKLSQEELEVLREHIQNALYDQSEHWQKIARVTKFFPNYMNAKISEQVIGSAITANISYYIDIRELTGIMKHLSLPFIAEVTQLLIPSKSAQIVNEIPLDLLRKVVLYLLQQDKHIVVASFIEVVNQHRVRELAAALKDADLLICAQYIKDKTLITHVFESFSRRKQLELLMVAIDLNLLDVLLELYMLMEDKVVLSLAEGLKVSSSLKFNSAMNQMLVYWHQGKFARVYNIFNSCS